MHAGTNFRSPNPPSPPASQASEVYLYQDLVLGYNTTTGLYTKSSTQKAFRLHLNMSYDGNVKTVNKSSAFVLSIRDALAIVFQVPSSAVNLPNATVYVKSVYNSSWPIASQSKYLGSDYTVVEFSSCVATNFSGNFSYLPYLSAWWSNPLNYWTATTCATCPSTNPLCPCAPLPISFWSSTTWFLKQWFTSDASLQSVRSLSLYGQRINELPPSPPPRPPQPPLTLRPFPPGHQDKHLQALIPQTHLLALLNLRHLRHFCHLSPSLQFLLHLPNLIPPLRHLLCHPLILLPHLLPLLNPVHLPHPHLPLPLPTLQVTSSLPAPHR